MSKAKNIETSLSEYVSISDAAKITNSDYNYVYNLQRKKRIRSETPDKKTLVNLIDLKRYITAHPPIYKDVVWDNIVPLEGESFFPVTGYDYRYFATNKGRLFNITTGTELVNLPRANDGYIQVILMKDGQEKNEYLHRIIAAACCPPLNYPAFATTAELVTNAAFEVHHIHIGMDGKSRNCPEDLLWTNTQIKYIENNIEITEHQKLHSIWENGNKKEYWKMVKNIRKNSERKLYKIAHPDYKPDAKFNYYLWVDAKGKSAYDKGKEIPLTSIFRESVECRSEEQGGQK